MKKQVVFQEEKEIGRLSVQNRIFDPYEQPVYEKILQGENLAVLDIGSNDGSKAVKRFTAGSVKTVIGLEYLDDVAGKAQQVYGDDKFYFYPCDVEAADFEEKLLTLMEAHDLQGFDIIHLSFVLMHLGDSKTLLKRLRQFLKPGGRLLVVDANDGVSRISPDPGSLFHQFKEILLVDPFAGDRLCGDHVMQFLAETGYVDIVKERELLEAGAEQMQKKKDLFEIFCTYLPEDILLLREQEPENLLYAAHQQWLSENYESLREAFLAREAEIAIGVSMITCRGN